jgi:hypothetical protein
MGTSRELPIRFLSLYLMEIQFAEIPARPRGAAADSVQPRNFIIDRSFESGQCRAPIRDPGVIAGNETFLRNKIFYGRAVTGVGSF